MSQRNLDRMPYGEPEPSAYEEIIDHLPDLPILPERLGDDGALAEVAHDGDELRELFQASEGLYRELPVKAWDPTLLLGHEEHGYLDPDETGTEMAYLEEEWEIAETAVTFYHKEGLRGRGTLEMTYDGPLDADEVIEMPFRVDVEQYLPEESAEQVLDEMYDL